MIVCINNFSFGQGKCSLWAKEYLLYHSKEIEMLFRAILPCYEIIFGKRVVGSFKRASLYIVLTLRYIVQDFQFLDISFYIDMCISKPEIEILFYGRHIKCRAT